MYSMCVWAAVAMGLMAGGFAQEVNLMTFNIRYGTADDGPNSWPQRRELVAETIRRQAPDVLGLQECLRFQAEELDAALPDYHWFGVGRDADGTGEMCAIFYRAKAFIPVAWHTFWLSETPDESGSVSWDSSLTRIASVLQLRHLASGKVLRVANTHFDHRGEEARRQSAALIARELAGPADAARVLLGDFNAVAETSAPWHTLIDAGFRDTWLEAPETAGPVTTWGAFGPPDPGADSRIDWILVRGPVEVLRCETVDFNEEGRYPSDHYPVCSRVRL